MTSPRPPDEPADESEFDPFEAFMKEQVQGKPAGPARVELNVRPMSPEEGAGLRGLHEQMRTASTEDEKERIFEEIMRQSKPPEIVDAARDELEIPADETDEG